jgi:hypothetical protein
MELKDTIELMTSADYKERFRAEYEQTRIRYEKLGEMLRKYRQGQLDFKPACPYNVLAEQHEIMAKYLIALEVRAGIEEVDLMPTAEKAQEDADKPSYITAYVPRKTK